MRPIDADAFIRHISNIERFEDDDRLFTYEDVKKMIRDMPTIETQRQGTFVIKRDEFYTAYKMYYAECSECKQTESVGMVGRVKYCPNCGAKMSKTNN